MAGSGIVGAWMIAWYLVRPPEVPTALPTGIGACRRASSSTSGPAARLMTPATHDATAVGRVHDRLYIHFQDTALDHANLHSLTVHRQSEPPRVPRSRTASAPRKSSRRIASPPAGFPPQ